MKNSLDHLILNNRVKSNKYIFLTGKTSIYHLGISSTESFNEITTYTFSPTTILIWFRLKYIYIYIYN